MGNQFARVHMEKQDLSQLQTRKVRALKKNNNDDEQYSSDDNNE